MKKDVSERIVSASQPASIRMRFNAKTLPDFVVVSYGVTRKSNLTGAAFNIGIRDFKL